MKHINQRAASPAAYLCLTTICFFALAGCSREWDIERPATGTAVSECVEAGHASARSQPGAFSLDFGDRTLWVFGETFLEETNAAGEDAVSNTAAWVMMSGSICNRDFDYLTDSQQELAQLIPFTDAERAFNDLSQAGEFRIWPTGGVVLDGVGYVFYEKVLLRGFLDVEPIGTGVALVSSDGVATRLTPAAFPDDPTLFWRAPRHGWGASALRGEDGYVYLYGASRAGALLWETRVARVEAEEITEPTAYRYWSGFDWVEDQSLAQSIFTGASGPSVAFNTFDGRYIAIYAPTLTNDVVMRTADNPWGPWAIPIWLFEGVSPDHFSIQNVRQHASATQNGDRELLVSYFSERADDASGLYLVTFDLGDI